MTRIIWTEDAAEDLIEIVSYQKTKYGLERAKKVYSGIQNTVRSLTDFNQKGRIVPELSAIGMNSYNEIIFSPWRIIYKVTSDSVYIVSLLDGRRNVEDILYKKVVDGKF